MWSLTVAREQVLLYLTPKLSDIALAHIGYSSSSSLIKNIGLLLTISDLLTISESYIVYQTPTYFIGVLYNISDSYLLYRTPTYYIGLPLIISDSDIIILLYWTYLLYRSPI